MRFLEAGWTETLKSSSNWSKHSVQHSADSILSRGNDSRKSGQLEFKSFNHTLQSTVREPKANKLLSSSEADLSAGNQLKVAANGEKNNRPKTGSEISAREEGEMSQQTAPNVHKIEPEVQEQGIGEITFLQQQIVVLEPELLGLAAVGEPGSAEGHAEENLTMATILQQLSRLLSNPEEGLAAAQRYLQNLEQGNPGFLEQFTQWLKGNPELAKQLETAGFKLDYLLGDKLPSTVEVQTQAEISSEAKGTPAVTAANTLGLPKVNPAQEASHKTAAKGEKVQGMHVVEEEGIQNSTATGSQTSTSRNPHGVKEGLLQAQAQTLSSEGLSTKEPALFLNPDAIYGASIPEEVNSHASKATTLKQIANLARSQEDIFAQIVQKAQVALKGENSEIQIQLKPEHLGRLNLKIVIEHGLITAKFVAESVQVKQLLESNLNQLKQSLGEQGLQLDRLEVSVRNEDHHQQRSWENPAYYGQGNNSATGSEGNSGISSSALAAAEMEFYEKANQNGWSGYSNEGINYLA